MVSVRAVFGISRRGFDRARRAATIGPVRRVFLVLRRVEAFVLATAMLAMAVATIANVFARNLTGDSLASTEELNQLLIVLVCFVGLSYAAGRGRHIRMTALSDAVPERWRRVLLLFVTASTAALLFVLSWYALQYALGVDRRSPVLGVPLGTVYLLAPFGLFLGGVQYLLAAGRNLRGEGVWISFEREDGYEELDVGGS